MTYTRSGPAQAGGKRDVTPALAQPFTNRTEGPDAHLKQFLVSQSMLPSSAHIRTDVPGSTPKGDHTMSPQSLAMSLKMHQCNNYYYYKR